MKRSSKIQTVVITAVITAGATSILWLVFGGLWFDRMEDWRVSEPGDPVVADNEAPGGAEETSSEADREMEDITAPIPEPPQRAALGTARTGLVIPVRGIEPSQLNDSFFQPRGANGERLHEAIDIMADTGTAVIAAADGTIAKLHNTGPGGNSVYVRSPDRRTIYYYAHLDRYAPDLMEGQSVRAGERLGTVGSSGNADPTAPHLHFAIMETTRDAKWWEPANAVNPYPVLIGKQRGPAR